MLSDLASIHSIRAMPLSSEQSYFYILCSSWYLNCCSLPMSLSRPFQLFFSWSFSPLPFQVFSGSLPSVFSWYVHSFLIVFLSFYLVVIAVECFSQIFLHNLISCYCYATFHKTSWLDFQVEKEHAPTCI